MRLDFLDAVRFTTMLLMIQGHTLDSLVRSDQLNVAVFPWDLWHALRGLTAPVFLLLSGISGFVSLDRDEDGRVPAHRIVRRTRWGLGLVGLGYLLVFPADRLADLRWLSPEVWRGFLQVNILQLTGLGLLLLTGLAALTRTHRAYALGSASIAVLLILAAPLMPGNACFRYLPEAVAAYLSQAHGSLFPLFPHGAFLFLGAGLGFYMKAGPQGSELSRFWKGCLGGAAGSGFLALLAWKCLPAPFQDPDGTSPAFTLARLGCALLLMAAMAWASRRISILDLGGKAFGRKSLHIYVGHLVLLYGLPWINGVARSHYRTLSLPEGFGAVLIVGSLTFGGVALMDLMQRRTKFVWPLLRFSSAVAVACLLLF